MEYYIYWDADYNGLDRDELLEVAKSEEEKETFIDSWCTRKAGLLLYGLRDEDKEYIKSMFRIQLFVVNEPRYK